MAPTCGYLLVLLTNSLLLHAVISDASGITKCFKSDNVYFKAIHALFIPVLKRCSVQNCRTFKV